VSTITHERQPLKKEPIMSFEDMAAAAQDPKNLPVEFEFDTTLVRTVAKEGQAWFVAKDVCDILGIADPSMALSRLDEDEKGGHR
jgi:prophage antirepressor-like protein